MAGCRRPNLPCQHEYVVKMSKISEQYFYLKVILSKGYRFLSELSIFLRNVINIDKYDKPSQSKDMLS